MVETLRQKPYGQNPMAETLPGKSKVSPCLSTQACDPKRDPTLPGKSKVSPCLSTQACDPKRDPTLPGKSNVSPCLSTQETLWPKP